MKHPVRIFLFGNQLASRLQNKAGGNLPAPDGGHQLFQIGNLPDVGALVDETPYMNGQLAAVYIICFIAKQIEKLRVHHADEEVEVLSVSLMMRNNAVSATPSVLSGMNKIQRWSQSKPPYLAFIYFFASIYSIQSRGQGCHQE